MMKNSEDYLATLCSLL